MVVCVWVKYLLCYGSMLIAKYVCIMSIVILFTVCSHSTVHVMYSHRHNLVAIIRIGKHKQIYINLCWLVVCLNITMDAHTACLSVKCVFKLLSNAFGVYEEFF